MCTHPRYITIQPTVGDRLKGYQSAYQIPIPCGKCAECLRQRQNSFMIRAYREAIKYGNMFHLTLTYDEDHLPMASSIRWVDIETGELAKYPTVLENVHKSWQCTKEVHVPRFHKRSGRRLVKDRVVKHFEMLAPSPLRSEVLSQDEQVHRSAPRIASVHHSMDESLNREYLYFETPSYDANDVVSLIKYCKLQFSRSGKPVENLRYLISPEYGERNTRRPHYHCILINCPYDFAKSLFHTWAYGRIVAFKNGNIRKHFGYGSRCTLQRVLLHSKRYKGNGLKNMAAYVSKYTCKGWLDNPAALDRFTVPMRVHTSLNFGSDISDSDRVHYLGLDFYDYDPNDISMLPEKKLSEIVDTIIRRLHYSIPGCYAKDGTLYPFRLPDCIRKGVFAFKLCKSRQDLPRYLRQHLPIGENFPVSGKTCYNAIYYAVSDALRNRCIQDSEREFKEFVSNFPSKDLSSAVAAFQSFQSARLQDRENSHRENLLRYIRSSKY